MGIILALVVIHVALSGLREIRHAIHVARIRCQGKPWYKRVYHEAVCLLLIFVLTSPALYYGLHLFTLEYGAA